MHGISALEPKKKICQANGAIRVLTLFRTFLSPTFCSQDCKKSVFQFKAYFQSLATDLQKKILKAYFSLIFSPSSLSP
jgi:hypothetical protein